MLETIEIRGARTHNLKNIDCTFRHGELTVVTGVSGSGKSSLAFDTLYAEGQRRFVESMSTYARQFLERMERPDLDSISGIQPAIALEQKNAVKSARSTVGTATEVHDYLRLLFAKLGETFCPDCKIPVRPETPESAMRAIGALPAGERLTVLGPTEMIGGHLNDALRAELIRSGYFRLWDGDAIVDLEAGDTPANPKADLAVLIDRIVWEDKNRTRLHEALQKAFTAGRGRAVVLTGAGQRLHFSAGMSCDRCHRAFPVPEPLMFSFYSPLGACPECEGFGRVMELDLDKVIPNPALSIDDGAIAPWNSEGNLELYDILRQRTTPREIPRLKPIAEFSPEQRRNLIEGVGKFKGIRGFFNWLESKKYKVQARVMLARYRAYRTCSVCLGTRLKPEALNVKIPRPHDRRTRHALGRTRPRLRPRPRPQPLANRKSLEKSSRPSSSASSTSTRSACPTSPSIADPHALRRRKPAHQPRHLPRQRTHADSLRPRRTHRRPPLARYRTPHRRPPSLRDLGNTVVVVEHDLDVIRAADHVLDLGPGAGEAGGRVLYEGPQSGLAGADSPTARHIRDYHAPPVPSRMRKPSGHLRIRGAKGNNLKNLTVKIPLGGICCVVGVSGSGKTTLIRDTLAAAYRRLREVAPIEAAPCRGIDGLEQVKRTPLRRSGAARALAPFQPRHLRQGLRPHPQGPRRAPAKPKPPDSMPAISPSTSTPAAARPAKAPAARPSTCTSWPMSKSSAKVRRPPLPPSVLAYRWQGKNIDEILRLTVDEAAEFFSAEPAVLRSLKPLREVGLGYLRLGQSTATLSGGEAQRLKLAGHLGRIREGEGLVFIFDEPTTGLHPADLKRLLGIFHEMADRGCTLIVIEHNLDLIASADTLIELGPEGGDRGGEILAQGSLRDLLRNDRSPTAHYLRDRFGPALEPPD
jgi:excinuclease ABC subunit A